MINAGNLIDYAGSGPHCYSSSLFMVLGAEAPAPAVIETLTGSPFGVQLVRGELPYFDPYGWDPEVGLDAAIELLGWRCDRRAGGTPEEALDRLRAEAARGPVLAGPLDMGLLGYQLGPPEGDHYVVVLAVDDDLVLLHDPHGHPFATLPTAEFVAAWRGEAVEYADEPFVMRTGFVREREVGELEALRRSLPRAAGWLAGRDDVPMPAGSLGGEAALERLAAQVEAGLDSGVRDLLAAFGVRLGARRLADAAGCLRRLGLAGPSEVTAELARAVGALQYPLVTGDDPALAAGLRRLAPGYRRLLDVLSPGTGR
ncbi:hypothetical protein [Saccharopolyspora taberi]|uniref:Uncharacterized protein n=1 Tax=Saccharopolyspora taberi TaxID=60895 RepID=A0ABN3V731_9PSEU